MKNKYRWGIMATGAIARHFAEALTVTDHGQLFAVASRNQERAKAFAERYGATRSYGSYQALIEDPEVDIIYIATPHDQHYPLSKACLEAGKAVLCEKPVTMHAGQFDALSQMANERNCFYMDALWTRFLPTIGKTLDLLPQIGPIRSIHADFGFKANFDPQSRLFNPLLGGGSLMDIGIYPVFLALLILGYPDEIRADAVFGSTGVDESLSAIFRYKSGALATLRSTFLADTKTEAEIAGELGTIYIHPRWHMPSHIELKKRGRNPEFYHFIYRKNGYEYEAEECMRCLDKSMVESSQLPHSFTSQLMKALDGIREKVGLVYPDSIMRM